MDKIKILYGDTEKESWLSLKSKLREDGRFKLLDLVKDGADLLKSIHDDKPDIVVADCILPTLDGLGVLESVMNDIKIKKKPKFIMTTTMATPLIENSAYKAGAEYLMVKPVNIGSLAERIKDVESLINGSFDTPMQKTSGVTDLSGRVVVTSTNHYNKYAPNYIYDRIRANPKNHREVLENMVSEDGDVEQRISDILHGLGTPSHIKGYLYLKEAIKLVCEDEKYLDGVTKTLYPKVAEKFGTTKERAERAIRNAIQTTFDKRKKDILDKIFTLEEGKTKPVNSEFISVIAEMVRDGNTQV